MSSSSFFYQHKKIPEVIVEFLNTTKANSQGNVALEHGEDACHSQYEE